MLKPDAPTVDGDYGHLFDQQTEALILGGILRLGDPALEQVRCLTPDDFAGEANRTIFRAILDLDGEIRVGLDSVACRLEEVGTLDTAGGLGRLVDLDRDAIAALTLTRFAERLKAKARDRRGARLAAKLNALFETGSDLHCDDVGSVIEELRGLREGGANGGGHIELLPNPDDSEESVSYIIEPELPERCVIGITGPSGEGKSSMATAWARNAIAAGRPVLVLDRENPRTVVVDRMKRLDLTGGPLLRWWGGWLRSEAPEPGAACVHDWVKSCVARGLFPLVIVDSLAAFNVGDENSAADMRRFMHQCRRLADLGATVLVIHHDGKADSSKDYRGSSDFKASLDQAFHCSNLSSDGKLDRLSLRCFKSRYGLSGSIVYRYAGGRFIRDERVDAPARTVADQLTELLRTNHGSTGAAFEALAAKKGIGRSKARDFLSDGLFTGAVGRKIGARNVHRYHLVAGGENDPI